MDCIMRVNVEAGDRLSSLPDDLIHKILSFINIKNAIETSVLSSRWRFLWTSMPYLTFSTEDFPTSPKFSKFVAHVLSRHSNNLTQVYSMNLTFRGNVRHGSVKRILKYAFSHNIQQLNVICLLENDIEFSRFLFSSQSLKRLSLTAKINRRYHNNHLDEGYFITPTSSWELSALTTLDLHSVKLCDDQADKSIGIFSKCANLQNLTLKQFNTTGSNGFSICHPRLSNLTLENSYFDVDVINVAAPQLMNLNISFCYADFVISACHLASLLYKGRLPLHLSTDCLHSLEKADICICRTNPADAHKIVSLLQQLHNVNFLSLNLETVEVLSSSVDLILDQPSPFVNLKSLKIYPERVWKQLGNVSMSAKLKSYLLDASPGTTVTMVSREEVQAQDLMAELRVLLEEEKDNSEESVDSHRLKAKMKLEIGGDMSWIKSCWEDLGSPLQRRKKKGLSRSFNVAAH